MMEAFRKLGFPAESLYIALQYSPLEPGAKAVNKEKTVCVHAHKDAAEFVASIGDIPCAVDEFTIQWEQAVALWNNARPEDAKALYDKILAPDSKLRLLVALARRGMLDAAITDVALLN